MVTEPSAPATAGIHLQGCIDPLAGEIVFRLSSRSTPVKQQIQTWLQSLHVGVTFDIKLQLEDFETTDSVAEP
jgi:hypothetical protein